MSNGLKMAQNALFPYFSELFLIFLLKHPTEQYRFSQWVIVWNFQSKKIFFAEWGSQWVHKQPKFTQNCILVF